MNVLTLGAAKSYADNRDAENYQFSATNLISNGNFSDGKTGFEERVSFGPGIWEIDTSTFVSSPQSLKCTSATYSKTLFKGLTTVVGHKYYLAVNLKTDGGIYLGVDDTGVGGLGTRTLFRDTTGTWIKRSLVITATVTTTYFGFFKYNLSTYCNVDNMMVLDLTEIFGEKKEPSAGEMDYLLSKRYTNGWFDGKSGTLVRTKELYDLLNSQEVVVKTPGIRPFTRVSNPVLTKSIVTDRTTPTGVADPFIVYDKGMYHMYFEVLGGTNPSTLEASDEIGHAWSLDGKSWTYTQIVISKETHGHRSAYPHVFKYEDEWYMLPDTSGNIKLYKATNFPLIWELQSDLISGTYVDTNIFNLDGMWYIITTNQGLMNGVSLFYNDSGDWRNTKWASHPLNPIIPNTASETHHRCAGNHFKFGDNIILPIQAMPTDTNLYGEYVYWYKLSGVTPTTCSVVNMGLAICSQRDGKWASEMTHHISHIECNDGNLFAVDGYKAGEYSIGLYEEGEQLIASSSITATTAIPATTWTPIVLDRGSYDTFEMHNRTTKALEIKYAGYYDFDVQIGHVDATFRILQNSTIVYTSFGNVSRKRIYLEPCTVGVEVYITAGGNIDITKTYIDCIKV